MQLFALSRRKFLTSAGFTALALRCAPLYSLANTAPITIRTPSGALRGEQSGHVLQFRDVLKAIDEGGSPLIDGPEGRRAVEIILGIYLAAETKGTVKLPLAADHRYGRAGADSE